MISIVLGPADLAESSAPADSLATVRVSELIPHSRRMPLREVLLVVGGILSLRLFLGWAQLGWRLRRAKALDYPSASVPVLECDGIGAPLTAWAGRTCIVLPSTWPTWTEERLAIVMRHEEAHVRRADLASLLVSRLARALYWFNPLVWLLARLEGEFAERAADDLVVGEGVPAWRYAEILLACAQGAHATGSGIAMTMARKTEVARRVEQVLKNREFRRPFSSRMRAVLLLTMVSVAVPIASLAVEPQMTSESRSGSSSAYAGSPATSHPTPGISFRCKVISKPVMEGPKILVSQELVDASPQESKLLASGTFRTHEGASIQIELPRSGGARRRVVLKPQPLASGKHPVVVQVQTLVRKQWRTDLKSVPAVAEKEFILLNLAGKVGAKRGTVVVIELMSADEAIASSP